MAALRLGGRSGRVLIALAGLNVALIAAVSLTVFAGRATITNVLLVSLVSLYLGGLRMLAPRARTLLIAGIAAVAVWYLGTSWISTREEGAAATYILEATQRAEMRPWVRAIVRENDELAYALVSIGYFASPIPTLHYYLQTPDLPGPFLGAYSFPLPARLVGTVDGTWTRDEWFALRQEIFAPISARGYFDNV